MFEYPADHRTGIWIACGLQGPPRLQYAHGDAAGSIAAYLHGAVIHGTNRVVGPWYPNISLKYPVAAELLLARKLSRVSTRHFA